VRLRVGIGRPSAAAGPTTISDADAISYVLGDFTPDQKQIINQAIPRVSEAILYLLTEDITAAMNRYN
jgi:PTH1 family peptidyl-tRNA hydrolase